MTTRLSTIAKHRWMEDMYDLIADRRLSEIAIPGTHDSGCYDFKWPKAAAAKTQNLTIAQQLEVGARYLDLRFEYNRMTAFNNYDFFIHHGLVIDYDVSLDVVFGDIKRFLEQNRKEILIIHLSHFQKFDDSLLDSFFRKVWDYIGQYANQKADNRSLIIKDMIKAGQRVYISVDGHENIPQDFRPYIFGNINSPYDEPTHMSGNPNTVMSHLNRLAEERKQTELWVLQGVMTLSLEKTIEASVASFAFDNIEDYARCINVFLMQQLPSWKGHFNIFICDYISAGMVDIALTINGALHQDQLSAGGVLMPGCQLISPNAKVMLRYQFDGNLVVYENVNGKEEARHATYTHGQKAGLVYFDGKDILLYHSIDDYVEKRSHYGRAGIHDRNPGNSRHLNKVLLQDDHNVVNYTKDRQVVWDWKTENWCPQ